jgi:small-conductance mechanosensitive channel
MTDKCAAMKRPGPVLRFLEETFDATFFYHIAGPEYKVGDLIGINSPGQVLNTQYAYRVECITWMHTYLVCLATGERLHRHNSRIFTINGVTNYSRSPATFNVVLPVGKSGGVSLNFFKEKIEQFANDNPDEWREANTFYWYQTPEGHHVMIQ